MENRGLSFVEARVLLSKFGKNEIKERSRVSWWKVFLNQIKTPIIVILFVAGLLSLFIGETIDGLMVLMAVFLNVILGFFQEYKAERTLEELVKFVRTMAKVKRDGNWTEIDSSLLTVGDVVRLEIGRTVPADGLILESQGLYFNEAILTGESVPVEKKVKDEVYMGTVVERGIGEMMVQRVGSLTKMGGIAFHVLDKNEERTPLKKKLLGLSRQLVIFIGVLLLLVVIEGILSGRGYRDIFTVAAALAVAGLPEGLVVSLGLILTVAMRRILVKKALVRRMLAAETLGGVDVVCLDKTGTITEGKMRAIDGQVCGGKEELTAMVKGAILCNDFRDPLEVAMDEWARQQLRSLGGQALQQQNSLGGQALQQQNSLGGQALQQQNGLGGQALQQQNSLGGQASDEAVVKIYERVGELPFDPKYKYIVTRHKSEKDGVFLEFLSGAPEVVLSLCDLREEIKSEWKEKFRKLGSEGYRLVGFADKEVKGFDGKIDRKEVEHYRWLGVVVYEDPLRVGVVEMIEKMKRAGVQTRMITGDYKETAWAVARQAGIVGSSLDEEMVLTGEEFSKMSEEELKGRLNKVMVFARTTPEQKLKIVSVLQSFGLVVAMTGDGVNDAPALKQADIGVVMGEATDVAKETADMVLLDNNFGTILTAIEEGRLVLVNLRRVVIYLLIYAFNGMFVIIPAMFFGWPLPLTATMILFLNLVSDGLPYLALAFEAKNGDLLLGKIKREKVLEYKDWCFVGLISGVVGILALSLFGFGFLNGVDLVKLRGMVMMVLGVVTLLMVFLLRDFERPVWKVRFWSNWWLNLAVFLGLVMLVVVGVSFFQVRIDLEMCLSVLGVFLVSVFLVEFLKWRLFYRRSFVN